MCPACGHPHRFKQQPLFIITGASGTGKTTVCLELANTISQAVVMDSDILWMQEFNKPEDDYRVYREMWLRVCKNISQGGRPVVLCGSAIPEQYENCIERRYFSEIHYLALVCDDRILIERLKNRPAWRKSASDDFLSKQIRFNQWFKANADTAVPKITLLDTTHDSLEKTTGKIQQWILEKLL